MAQPHFQTSFASGEWAPKLRSRVDVQKYHAGAQLLRNWYVDFAGGGASTRPGTQFSAQVGANGARLIPFQPSSNISYVLEFGQNYVRFFSNGAQIKVGGNPYQISSPFAASDLFPNPITGNPGIEYVQDAGQLIICHPNYQPQILTINNPTNWTLSTINFGTSIPAPTGITGGSSLAAGSWCYAYTVTAVDQFGHESAVASIGNFNFLQPLESTPGDIGFIWTAVPGAISYNVYKAFGIFGSAVPTSAQFGFIANVNGTGFTDSTPGITPDMSQTPPIPYNPFSGLSVVSAMVGAAGTYTTVPSVTFATPPSGSRAHGYVAIGINTAVPATLIVSSSRTPVGQQLFDNNGIVLNVLTAHNTGGSNWQVDTISIANNGSITNIGAAAPATGTPSNGAAIVYVSGSVTYTWGVDTVNVYNGGFGYSAPPAITFSSGAATATAILSAGGAPGVPGFFQERLALAGAAQAQQTVNLSVPGDFFNNNYSNPSQDDDGIQAQIIGEELNDIRALLPVQTGLIALTGQGAWLINGGGGVSSAAPITPSNASAQTQAFNGATDVRPIKINMDFLYVTNKGNYVRDSEFNIYANLFQGKDISVISNHLFFGYQIIDWTWAEEPFKTLWVIRNDGIMLSLGYVKEHDLVGWAHHDTNGQFMSVCSVIESTPNGNVDAVYVIVQRFINGAYVQYVERLADRFFPYGFEDSWAVDCGLQTQPQATLTGTLTLTGDASAIGNSVTLADPTDAPFTAPMAAGNWIVRAGGGIYKITAFTSTSQVTASVVRVPPTINPYTNVPYPVTADWTLWQPVTTVSGLTQLANQSITGVADGVVVTGTVSNTGTFTLPNAATKVTLGLAFLPQMQTLPLDLGEPTVQGKRKKISAVTLRVADTLGLQIGTSFANAVTMKDFILGNVGTQSNAIVTDLVAGDGRTIIDQAWQEAGSYCIQQNLPYPATVLGAMPEITVGDTPK